jgi:hypothetical protein
MNTIKPLTAALMLILIFIFTYSCVNVNYMKTDRAEPSEITGTYTLLLYGGRYSEDVENVAIFDKEGDKYSFEIFAPGYDYTVKKGVQGKEALAEAVKHVGSHRSFFQSRLSRILDTEGNVIGYELRPIYHLTEFGMSDILYINYTIKDNKVITKIRLKYELENREPFLFRGGKGH